MSGRAGRRAGEAVRGRGRGQRVQQCAKQLPGQASRSLTVSCVEQRGCGRQKGAIWQGSARPRGLVGAGVR